MTDQSTHLTVLMPAYNAGPYIKEAIESILHQTYSDFEFLIVNDGSKDETLEVIKQFKDTRIKLIDQQNKGLIDTLNEALQIAKGDLIARMDADDVCFPQRLERQVAFLQEHPDYVAVGAEANVIDKDGNFLYHLKPIGYTNEEINERINIKVPFIHPSVVFRKSAVIKAGGYPKNALQFEDHLLWKRLLLIGKVHNLKEILLNFRFNPESVTVDEKWRGKEFIEIRKRSIETSKISDEDAVKLRSILNLQKHSHFKEASYYAMIGKKYLWNNPNSALARRSIVKAIELYPGNWQSYLLYAFSFVPPSIRVFIYNLAKR